MIIKHDISLLSQHFRGLYHKLNGDLSPVMWSIGYELEQGTRKRFETKTDPDGVRWTPLSLATLARKKNKNNILKERNHLFESITHHASKDSALVGAGAEHAQYHQTGTKHMVARRMFGISSEDKANIQELLNGYLTGKYDD